MLKFILTCLWEGFAAAVIVGTTAVMAMHNWPSDPWQFVVLGCGVLAAFVKGVDAYRKTPH